MTNDIASVDTCMNKVAENMTNIPPTLVSTCSTKDVSIGSLHFLVRSSHLRRSTELSLHIETIDSHHPMGITALLDSGATGLFIDEDFVKAKNITTHKLPHSIAVYNIDGTLNQHGSIKETVELIIRFQDHTERATFHVTTLGGVPIILGHPWLTKHNPDINWETGEIKMTRCPSECRIRHIQLQRQRRQRRKLKVRATTTPATRMAEEAAKQIGRAHV